MENKILDEIEKKYKDSLSSEKTKISELVEGIELEEGMDNKIVEALIGASLLSLQNGYELYKRRVKDGLIAEPNDYLEVFAYQDSGSSLNTDYGEYCVAVAIHRLS